MTTIGQTNDLFAARVEGSAVRFPPAVPKRLGLSDGATILVVAHDGKSTLYPRDEDGEAWDEQHGVEVYTPERVATFLLNNASCNVAGPSTGADCDGQGPQHP
jgi:antitoxin component of MazEF toxin-antitoxin module